MNFQDEYKTLINGTMYTVAVEGKMYKEDHSIYTEVHEFVIVDEDDNLIVEEHPDYEEIVDEVNNRDYTYKYEHHDDYTDMF